MNALTGHPYLFDDLASSPRSIQQVEQSPPAGARQPFVPPRSIRKGIKVTGFSARCRIPSFGLVIFGKFELGQYAQRSSGFPEGELCLYGDFGLGLLAMPERNQAGS